MVTFEKYVMDFIEVGTIFFEQAVKSKQYTVRASSDKVADTIEQNIANGARYIDKIPAGDGILVIFEKGR